MAHKHGRQKGRTTVKRLMAVGIKEWTLGDCMSMDEDAFDENFLENTLHIISANISPATLQYAHCHSSLVFLIPH